MKGDAVSATAYINYFSTRFCSGVDEGVYDMSGVWSQFISMTLVWMDEEEDAYMYTHMFVLTYYSYCNCKIFSE